MDISIDGLKPHPRNIDIYGEEDVTELAERIKSSGWIKPITVTQDFTIISGHRRVLACQQLGKTEIPCEIETFPDESAILERLLLENENREKTTEQKTREYNMWLEVEKLRAQAEKKRAAQQQKKQENQYTKGKRPRETGEVTIVPTLGTIATTEEVTDEATSENSTEKPTPKRSRDNAAQKVGLGKMTAEKATKVVARIDKLKEEGNQQEAEILTEVLNKNVTEAKRMADGDKPIKPLPPKKTSGGGDKWSKKLQLVSNGIMQLNKFPTEEISTLDEEHKKLWRQLFMNMGTVSRKYKKLVL